MSSHALDPYFDASRRRTLPALLVASAARLASCTPVRIGLGAYPKDFKSDAAGCREATLAAFASVVVPGLTSATAAVGMMLDPWYGVASYAGYLASEQLLAAGRLRHAGTREWWGEAHVALMQRVRHRMMVVATLGLTPPAGRLTLDADGTPRLTLDDEPGLEHQEHEIEVLLRRKLLDAGCTMLEVDPVDRGGQVRRAPWFTSAHQVGSCRMADAPMHGVTSPEGEVFNYPGLYVTDGAAVPSSLAVNTSLTILANAERIADGIVRRLQHAA
jgi:choline dehydrogenase-like flavoprotein